MKKNLILKSNINYRGKEFHFITTKLSSLGIIHMKTCPHNSEQNGVVETCNRRVLERGMALLLQSGLLMNYWLYAFCIVMHVLNILPIKALKGDIPVPYFYFLRAFGCLCYPCLKKCNTHRLQPPSLPCIFLGYASQ